MDSIIMPFEFLYAAYVFDAEPDLNAILIAPAAIKKGSKPKDTKAVLHSNTKAIVSPVNNVERFCINPYMYIVVIYFTFRESTANRDVKAPTLFFGLSYQ